MNLTYSQNTVSDRTILLAVIGSFLLHAFLAFVVPNFKFDAPLKEKPTELKIELVKPEPPKPEVIPEPPKPEPPKPLPEPIQPKPKKIVEPKLEIKPEVRPVPDVAPVEAPPPKLIAVEPKPDAPATKQPEFIVPEQPKEPPKKVEPTVDIDGARDAYIKNVQRELQRNIRYPKMAQQRGIQGETKVEIQLDNEGNVVSVTVVESSGNETLDEAAIDTVKRSDLKQHMKEALYGKFNKITVPLSFKLK